MAIKVGENVHARINQLMDDMGLFGDKQSAWLVKGFVMACQEFGLLTFKEMRNYHDEVDKRFKNDIESREVR